MAHEGNIKVSHWCLCIIKHYTKYHQIRQVSQSYMVEVSFCGYQCEHSLDIQLRCLNRCGIKLLWK